MAIIDHASSVRAYERGLCEALASLGIKVLLVGAEETQDELSDVAGYRYVGHFYGVTNAITRAMPGLRRFNKVLRLLEYLPNMISLFLFLRRERPDVIHFQTLPLPLLDMWLVPHFRSIGKLIVTAHDTSHREESPVQFRGFFKCLRRFDHVMTLSEFSRRKVLDFTDFLPEQVTVTPHGPDDYYRKVAAKTSVDRNAKGTILFFGVVKRYKGIDLLIDAFSRLPKELSSEVELVIAGNPSINMQPLMQMAADLGVDRQIRWDLRFIPDRQVWPLFEEASVVVFPYREIDQSGAMHIALDAGRPIVATEVGGVTEILTDEFDSLTVPPENVDALATAIERLLVDAELAERVVANLSKTAERLDWTTTARRTAEVYAAV